MANLKAEMIVISKQELEELVYKVSYEAANKATTSLFNGLSKRFMYQFEEDIQNMLFELEELNRK